MSGNLFIKKDLTRLSAILFLVEFVRGAYLVSFLPTFASNGLGFSISLVGIAVSVHYITDTVMKSISGYLLDRFSLRIIVHTGLFISLLGLIAMYNIHDPWVLIVTAGLFGVGISPIWLVCLSKVEDENRASQMGVLYTMWLVGLGSGPVIINLLIDKGYSLTFWVMISLWALAWIFALQLKNGSHSILEQIPLQRQLKLLWDRLRTMKPLLPGMVLQTTAAGMLVPILPGFAVKSLGISHMEYSFVLIAGGALTVA